MLCKFTVPFSAVENVPQLLDRQDFIESDACFEDVDFGGICVHSCGDQMLILGADFGLELFALEAGFALSFQSRSLVQRLGLLLLPFELHLDPESVTGLTPP